MASAPDSDPPQQGDRSQPDTESQELTRREALGYATGSAALTFGIAGAGWYGLIYEPLTPEEKLVRTYFDAINRNKYRTAERLFHRQSPDYSWASDNIRNLLRMRISVEDTRIGDRWEQPEHPAVREFALVVASVTLDSGEKQETFDIGLLLAQNTAGDWRIWRDDGGSNRQ